MYVDRHFFLQGDNYFELDVDVGSSSVARFVCLLFVVDLVAFLISACLVLFIEVYMWHLCLS